MWMQAVSLQKRTNNYIWCTAHSNKPDQCTVFTASTGGEAECTGICRCDALMVKGQHARMLVVRRL
jgi:Fe-S-cluster containining protein